MTTNQLIPRLGMGAYGRGFGSLSSKKRDCYGKSTGTGQSHDNVFEDSIGSVSNADHCQWGEDGHRYEDPILGRRGIDESGIVD